MDEAAELFNIDNAKKLNQSNLRAIEEAKINVKNEYPMKGNDEEDSVPNALEKIDKFIDTSTEFMRNMKEKVDYLYDKFKDGNTSTSATAGGLLSGIPTWAIVLVVVGIGYYFFKDKL